nr:acyltransferase [Duganella fentianensis]
MQAGRALAAISVTAFHLSIAMGLARYGGNAAFSDYTSMGHHGVDFFFVLSGFIILFAHVDDIGRPECWRDYFLKRFVRLFPIYWLYSLPFVLLLLLGFGTDAKLPTEPLDWLTNLTLIRFNNALPILPPSWTLFHEIGFYAVFSLLIVRRSLGIAAFVVFIAGCLIHYNYPGPDDRTPLNVYTASYNLYFLFGMGAYWLYAKGGKGIAELLLGLVLFSYSVWGERLPYHLTPLLLACSFALLLAAVAKLEQSGRLHVPGILLHIGNASYTIYLIHEALEGLLLKMVIRSGIYGAIGAHASYLLVLAGVIALGCLAYLLVERPVLNFLRRRLLAGRNKARAAALAPSG